MRDKRDERGERRDMRDEGRDMRDERQEERKRWTRNWKAKWFTSKLR